MPGYRGIFLDSIHPNIVKRLDYNTLGFQRANKTGGGSDIINKPVKGEDDGSQEGEAVQYNYQRNLADKAIHSQEIFKYLQERQVWTRVVPFGSPQEYYEAGNNLHITHNVEVPLWRNWVFYGTKAAQIHGTVTKPIPWEAQKSHNVTGIQTGPDHKTGLYNTTGRSWDKYAGVVPGALMSPPPGVSSIQVSNKGDMGTIRRISFDIKVLNLSDLEAIEMMYMVPGISVLVE